MKPAGAVLLAGVVVGVAAALARLREAGGQPGASPELLDVRSGALTLRAPYSSFSAALMVARPSVPIAASSREFAKYASPSASAQPRARINV